MVTQTKRCSLYIAVLVVMVLSDVALATSLGITVSEAKSDVVFEDYVLNKNPYDTSLIMSYLKTQFTDGNVTLDVTHNVSKVFGYYWPTSDYDLLTFRHSYVVTYANNLFWFIVLVSNAILFSCIARDFISNPKQSKEIVQKNGDVL